MVRWRIEFVVDLPNVELSNEQVAEWARYEIGTSGRVDAGLVDMLGDLYPVNLRASHISVMPSKEGSE